MMTEQRSAPSSTSPFGPATTALTALAGRQRARLAGGCLFAALGAVALAATEPSSEQWQVLAPALCVLVILGLFSRSLVGRSGALPFDDLGFWHVGIVSLYLLIPVGVYLALGLEYTQFNDLRLFTAQPSAALVARIGWYHIAYLASVAISYRVVVGRSLGFMESRAPAPAGPAFVLAAILILIFCQFFFIALSLFYDLAAESYFDEYLVVQSLPLFARQVFRLVTGVQLVAKLAVLVWLFSDFPRRRWLLAAWLVLAGVGAFVGGGSRTALMVLLAGSGFLYHHCVRPLSFRVAAVTALIAISAFTALGFMRQFRALESGPDDVFISSGEFDAVFANSVDLAIRRERHEFRLDASTLYMSEIFSPIPSQLLPFAKIDLGDWYRESFYPGMRERGQAFAFGVVPQAIVGLGWPELLVRGTFIGWVFGLLTRLYRRHGNRPGVVVGYLWFTTMSYQVFRNTSFSLFTTFVQQFVPATLLLWILSALMLGARSRRYAARPAEEWRW